MSVVVGVFGPGGIESAWKAVDDFGFRLVDHLRLSHLSHPHRVVGDQTKTTFQDTTFST